MKRDDQVIRGQLIQSARERIATPATAPHIEEIAARIMADFAFEIMRQREIEISAAMQEIIESADWEGRFPELQTELEQGW